MDFITSVLVCILTCIVIAYYYGKRKHSLFTDLGIPGPKPATFVGVIPMMSKAGVAWNDVELMSKYGKVVGVYVGHRPSILVTDPDIIQEVCVNKFQTFVNRASVMDLGCTLRSAVALSQDEQWVCLRSKLAPIFSPEKLKTITPALNECVDEFLENIDESFQNGPNINFSRQGSFYSMDVLSTLVFGHDVKSQKNPEEEIIRKTMAAWHAGNKTVVPYSLVCSIFPMMSTFFRRCNFNVIPEHVRDYFYNLSRSAIHERRNDKSKCRNDFMQFMMDSNNEEKVSNGQSKNGTVNDKKSGLSESDIMSNSLFFVLAGYDTVANALAFTAYCLATNPDCQDKLIKEIDDKLKKDISYETVMNLTYLDKCVKETFRIYPPFLRFNRTASDDITIKDIKIPKGSDIGVPIFALHRDPEVWQEPEVFKPERFDAENVAKRHKMSYLPFGVGPRDCFGKTFAVLEVKLAIVRLLQKYMLKTSDKTEIPPTLEKGGFSKAANGIILQVSPRQRS